MTSIIAFESHVPQQQIDDLRRRLSSARWPEPETVADFSQGLQLHRLISSGKMVQPTGRSSSVQPQSLSQLSQ